MKMKVIELSHDEIVDLVSTALEGCDYMGIDYSSQFWNALPEDKRTKDPCIEDKVADILLAGGSVTIADYYAEECGLVKGRNGKMVPGDEWNGFYGKEVGTYTLTLQDLLDACSSQEGLGYATTMFIDESGDYFTANNLLQVALFGEVIYG